MTEILSGILESDVRAPYGQAVVRQGDYVGLGVDTQDDIQILLLVRGLAQEDQQYMEEAIQHALLALRGNPRHERLTPWTAQNAPSCTLHTCICVPGERTLTHAGWHAARIIGTEGCPL